MQENYDFKTRMVIDPLKELKYFYINPYMPDNMKLLGLRAKLIASGDDDITTCATQEGFVVTLFSLKMLIDGPCHVKWTDQDKFCINNSIWCKIVGEQRDTIRIDTVRFQ